jgi:predicted metal-dependent hydrolase
MNTNQRHLTVGGLKVHVVRKAIKNLHLGVYPPSGRVRVAVPLTISDNAVRMAVVGKLGWIKRQRKRFQLQPRQSEREMVSGESHYFLGRRYRLRVIYQNRRTEVVLRSRSTMEVYVQLETTPEQRERVLRQWYRQKLKEIIPPLVEKWQPILNVQVADWGIKKMKTKWGSCNAEAQRIWLNLELAKKPVRCLEYTVVHEMAHFLERQHNDRFISLLDQYLPHWRLHRQELNSAPLAHETWRKRNAAESNARNSARCDRR